MPFEAEVGHTVGGKYELVRLLGRGSMGEVWLARHKTLAEEVAVKFLKVEMSGPEEMSMWLSRFLFEAQIAARLSRKSRHIVQVTDHGEESGKLHCTEAPFSWPTSGRTRQTRRMRARTRRTPAQTRAVTGTATPSSRSNFFRT